MPIITYSSSLRLSEELETPGTSRGWPFFLTGRFLGKDEGFNSTSWDDLSRLHLLLVGGTPPLVLVGSLRALLSFRNLQRRTYTNILKSQHRIDPLGGKKIIS